MEEQKTTPSLKIVRLEVSRVKRIKGTVEIVPNGNIVTLTGKNRQGKSSCLDAIAMALGGKDCVPDQPINDKASKAHIIADLHDIVVTRKFTSSGSTLTVKAKDGTELRSPQAVLDSLWNSIALEPLKFVRLSDTTEGQRKQFEILSRLVGLDFSKIDADRKAAYDNRTLANRELEAAKGKLANYPADPTAPADEVKVSELMAELQKVQNEGATILRHAEDLIRENEKVRDKWKDVALVTVSQKTALNELDAEIGELEKLLEQKRNIRVVMDTNVKQLETTLAALEKDVAKLHYPDLDEIRARTTKEEEPVKAKISQADEQNGKVRAAKRRKEIMAEVDAAQAKVDTLTETITKLAEQKQQQLANAQFPLPGLSVDDDGVRLDGKPFAQGSQAEQLEAAVAIGLSLKPGIRVVLIRDASLMDEDTTARIAKIAADHDAQIWLETVESDDPSAIVIEDGAIKE
jgi:recombinational DNA repair ATPase RecF